MAYPVAYRKGSAPAARPPGSQGRPSPLPANDNRPPARAPTQAPANDNFRSPPSNPAKQFGRSPALAGYAAKSRPYVRGALRASRIIGRLSPFGRLMDAYEILKPYSPFSGLNVQPFAQLVVDTTGTDFTLTQTCCPKGANFFTGGIGWVNCSTTCGLQVGKGGATMNYVAPSDREFITGLDYPQPYINGFNQWYRFQRWNRPFGSRNIPPKAGFTTIQPAWVPWVNPSIDPLVAPNVMPVPAKQIPYKVLPGRRPNPLRSPTEQSTFGYSLGVVTGPGIQPGPQQAEFPAPGNKPRPVPGHKPQKPGPGVKEKKTKLQKGMVVALRAGYTATEAIDAIEAIHKALPKKYQAPPGSTPQAQLLAIYKNINHLDMQKVVLNLITNHILDLLIGRASAKADPFFKKNGISGYGLQF